MNLELNIENTTYHLMDMDTQATARSIQLFEYSYIRILSSVFIPLSHAYEIEDLKL